MLHRVTEISKISAITTSNYYIHVLVSMLSQPPMAFQQHVVTYQGTFVADLYGIYKASRCKSHTDRTRILSRT